MAKRYSGDIEIRISYKLHMSWSGKPEMFYIATIAAPDHRGNGILSPREVGVDLKSEDPQSSESYDKAAFAFLALANKQDGIGEYAGIEDGKVVMLRVQQAPCPISSKPRARARGRGSR
jgi:hypothetical protein